VSDNGSDESKHVARFCITLKGRVSLFSLCVYRPGHNQSTTKTALFRTRL